MENHMSSPNFDLIFSSPLLNSIRNLFTKFHSVCPRYWILPILAPSYLKKGTLINLAKCKIHQTQNSLCIKIFTVLICGNLESIQTTTSQKPRISFLPKSPPPSDLVKSYHTAILVKCKTHWTQNVCAQRLLWYSFGDIWRPSQPPYLKNHKFHFFPKLPTRPSS